MPEYIVELLVVVEANSATDAEAMGERAQAAALKVPSPPTVTSTRIVNVILADVRDADDRDAHDALGDGGVSVRLPALLDCRGTRNA